MTEKVDFDLDARLAEAEDRQRTIKFAGRFWTLPAKYPTRAVQVTARMRKVDIETDTGKDHALALYEAFVAAFFGDQTEDVLAAGLDEDGLDAILDAVYGVKTGEAQASVSPS